MYHLMKFGEEYQQKKLENVNEIGVVILSRFSSSRLYGKALMEIKGKKILEYIIERVHQVFPLENIILATSIEKSDDAIANFAEDYGVRFFRGSLDNVSRRFYEAANQQGWKYAIRINGDNIFLDIPLLREMAEIASKNSYNFVSNVKDRTYPKGMSVEIVNVNHYKEKLHFIESNDNYKEHVTLYLYDNIEDNYYFVKNTSLPKASGIQLALDTEDDLKRTIGLITKFKKEHYYYNLVEVFELLENLNNE